MNACCRIRCKLCLHRAQQLREHCHVLQRGCGDALMQICERRAVVTRTWWRHAVAAASSCCATGRRHACCALCCCRGRSHCSRLVGPPLCHTRIARCVTVRRSGRCDLHVITPGCLPATGGACARRRTRRRWRSSRCRRARCCSCNRSNSFSRYVLLQCSPASCAGGTNA